MSAKRRKARKPRAVIEFLREPKRNPVKPPKVDYADLPNINYYDLFIIPGRDVQHCDAAVIYHRADTMGRKLHPGMIASGISRPHCPVCMRRLGKKAIEALEKDPAMHTNTKRRHPDDPGVIVHTLRMFRMPKPAREVELEPEAPPQTGYSREAELPSAFAAVPEPSNELTMDELVADEPLPYVTQAPNIFDPHAEAPPGPELPKKWEILDDPNFAGIRLRGFLQPNSAGVTCGPARVGLVSLQSPPFGPTDGQRLRAFLSSIPMALRTVRFVELEIRRKIQQMEQGRGALLPFHEFDSFAYDGDIPGQRARPQERIQIRATDAMDICEIDGHWDTHIPAAGGQLWQVGFPQEIFSKAEVSAILMNVAHLGRGIRTRSRVQQNILRTCQARDIESKFNAIRFLDLIPEGEVQITELEDGSGWQIHARRPPMLIRQS